jgi:Right handed beta helix region
MNSPSWLGAGALAVLVLVAVLLVSGLGGALSLRPAASSPATPAGALPRALQLGGSPSTTITYNGSWDVRGWVNDTDVRVVVHGNVVVEPAAHLDFLNSTLEIMETGNLAYGVAVDSEASLVAKSLVLESSPTSDHTYLRSDAGATLRLTGGTLADIGGNVGGEQGLFVQSAGAEINGTTFEQYYQAIVVSGATDVQVSGVSILNSTATANTTFAVDVFGLSSGFELSHSTLHIPEGIGALSISAPYAQVVHNTFTLDPTGTGASAIYFAEMLDGAQRADHSSFSNNSVTGSGFIDEVGSYVTIWGNQIHDTGPDRPYGIMVEVPLWTLPGLWVHNLTIDWNTISDYSRYGIRLQQNVSNFWVSHNTIDQPSVAPGPPSTVKFGGPQIDAFYLIRGVKDGTISDNYVDDSDRWYVATDGMTLESDVSYVNVVNNEFINVSQAGVVLQGNVPGFDNALPWQCGPSVYDVIANNLFDNERAVLQTNFTVEGILDWQWANHSSVENNTFDGWQNVPTTFAHSGSIVLTTGSYGLYWNNTVQGARYGFVFTNFTGVAHPYSGEFNRSDNLVYGNHLSGITILPVFENLHDGMGPLHNVIVVLSNTSVAPGVPLSYVESIVAAASFVTTEAGKVYTETLRTASPLTGAETSYTTSLSWSAWSYSLNAATGVGAGRVAFTVSSLAYRTVNFTTTAATSMNLTINLYPTSKAYTAVYSIQVTTAGVTTTTIIRCSGPATFKLPKGTDLVSVDITSYTIT